jgi:FtsP/CotA-like multicopper oxidase with cupredoxin domain
LCGAGPLRRIAPSAGPPFAGDFVMTPAPLSAARLAAPLALAAALAFAPPAAAAPAAGWGSGKTVAITVTNDRFIPSRVVLKSGRHYTLVFRNPSNRGHNFSAKSFFDIARVDPRDARLVRHDQVNLAAGARATVRIVAPDTPNAAYAFRSTVLADAAEKLKGTIVVTR